jgi:hypothetical protein
MYIRTFYKHDYNRLAACLSVFHDIIHFPDVIEKLGPMWVYTQFPMERLIGVLGPLVRSGRHPYQNLVNEIESHQYLSALRFIFPKFNRPTESRMLRKNPTLSFPPFVEASDMLETVFLWPSETYLLRTDWEVNVPFLFMAFIHK